VSESPPDPKPSVLYLTQAVHGALVAHAYAGLPLEACGLLAGDPAAATATAWYPCRNVAASSRVYTLHPSDHLRAELDAEDRGLEILGVVHSHTHTEPYPSPTDIAQAPDPAWHYVIVSLKREVPAVRSWRIVAGEVTEVAVVLAG
jgi:[CysO sulfur-carrier protein]-S-L-cysteine hydrolase